MVHKIELEFSFKWFIIKQVNLKCSKVLCLKNLESKNRAMNPAILIKLNISL